MAYEVLARKWRPQIFEDVVGQEAVTKTLQNAIRSGRVAHAFLFSGGRGVGKTTTARILAKALNCQRGPLPTPCGECVSCEEIVAGGSVDVLEIDAASNTGVDNIRELRENIRYAPARDRFKIFIIDEAHMLSNAAFNALLKTLEEPPPHVKFVLATTEHHKIPPTITSRCQQYDFKAIPFRLILSHMSQIALEEGVEVSEYALHAVVSAAQGSMRDAQSTLDQMIAFSGKRVRDEDVRALLGLVEEPWVAALVSCIFERNREALLKQLQELVSYGIDAQNLSRRLVDRVRNLLVCKISGWDEDLLHLPDSEKDELIQQAEGFSELDLIRFYDLLNRTENELRWNPHPHIHLEIALVKLVELAQLPEVEEVIDQLQSGSTRLESPQKKGSAPFREVKPQRTGSLFQEESVREPENTGKSEEAAAPGEPLEADRNPVLSQLFRVVQLEAIRLYSSLQYACRTEFENGKLSIVFPASEQIHYEVLHEAASMDRLRQLCAKITDSAAEIEVELLEATRFEEGPGDPTQDPQVQAFIEKFPGKVIVEKGEEVGEEGLESQEHE